MAAPTLTQTQLREMLTYDPETGVFIWRQRPLGRGWNKKYAGKIAGFDCRIRGRVYRSIRIFDWPFMGHRLAWLYMTGEWPSSDIDHINMDGLDNRWANLRVATKAENGANRRRTKRNTTGFKGVSPDRHGSFRATIQVNGKWRWLGRFKTAKAAHAAYLAAAKEGYGEFARGE